MRVVVAGAAAGAEGGSGVDTGAEEEEGCSRAAAGTEEGDGREEARSNALVRASLGALWAMVVAGAAVGWREGVAGDEEVWSIALVEV